MNGASIGTEVIKWEEGGQCIKRRPRCFGVCQFINKMGDGGGGGWGGSRRGRCFSTKILTNNKNNKNKKKSTKEKKNESPQLKSEHFIIYTQYIFPSSAFWFLKSFFPCFPRFLSFFFFFFKLKPSELWLLASSVNPLKKKKKRRMFTSLLGADSVVEK